MKNGRAGERPLASVVIPAHDEAAVIVRTLSTLTTGLDPGDLEVVVVCNGCSDETAALARNVAGVRVMELENPSKALAVELGDGTSRVFPRVHLDADVEITGADVLALVAALRDRGVLAAGPRRLVPLASSSWPVRAYYRVWNELPHVQRGLFGRGVFALTEEGQARIDALPTVMSDDLAVSDAFAEHERAVVDEVTVTIHPPRTVRDLVRRRTRVATGNAEAGAVGVRRRESSTTVGTLIRLGWRRPRAAMGLPVFLAVSLVAKHRARGAVRTGDFTTWLRDESSRERGPSAPTSRAHARTGGR